MSGLVFVFVLGFAFGRGFVFPLLGRTVDRELAFGRGFVFGWTVAFVLGFGFERSFAFGRDFAFGRGF